MAVQLTPPPTRETVFNPAWWRWISSTAYPYLKSLVTNSNPSLLINGNFGKWDYGTSQTSNGYASANRWRFDSSGSSHSVTRQSFTLGQTDVPGNPEYYCQIAVTSVTGAANYSKFSQRIEHVRMLSNGKAIATIWLRATTAGKYISAELYQVFGTGGSPSSSVSVGAKKFELTTQFEKYEFLFDVDSVSGKTLGSNADDYLELNLWLDAGTNYDSRTSSLGQQSATFHVAQGKIEEGTADTGFNNIHPLGYTKERYLFDISGNQFQRYIFGQCYSTTGAILIAQFPVEMRATPALSHSNNLRLFKANATRSSALTSLTINTSGTKVVGLLAATTSADLVAGDATILTGDGTNSGYLRFGSEL